MQYKTNRRAVETCLPAPWKAATWIQPVPRVVAPLHRINPQLLRHASAALTRRRPTVTLAGSLLHSLLPLTSVLGVSSHDSHASHATRLPDLPAPCPCHATIVSSHGIISMLPRWCNTAAAQPACLRDALRLCDPATRTPNLRLCLSVPTPPHPPLWQESNACREDAP